MWSAEALVATCGVEYHGSDTDIHGDWDEVFRAI